MLYYLLSTLFVINCFVLLLVVLIQTGKAGDIASAFGGGGSSQAAFGARSGATLLTKVTWVSAILFFVGALGLSMISRGPGSVVGAVPAPPAPAQSAPAQTDAPAPAQPAPAGQPAEPAPADAPAQPQP
jgi:preprotein translocase subunit SecG